MREQLDLRYPIARNTDPETSHASAHETTKTNRKTQCLDLLRLIRFAPGGISADYETRAVPQAWKRVSDLKNQGLIYYGTPRVNPATGRKCSTIWPTDSQKGSC